MFKPDSLGSTFWFIDLDFNGSHHEPNLAYLEIARDLKFWKVPVALHVEYNGGMLYSSRVGAFNTAFSNIGIVGVSGQFQVGHFSLGSYIGYRFDDAAREGAGYQWTATWFSMLWNNRITLSGFMDVWTQDQLDASWQPDGKKVVVITEPQIWYNITPAIAAGGEIEISHNFIPGSKKIEAFPTLGAKFTF
jgi:hypothetical protein